MRPAGALVLVAGGQRATSSGVCTNKCSIYGRAVCCTSHQFTCSAYMCVFPPQRRLSEGLALDTVHENARAAAQQQQQQQALKMLLGTQVEDGAAGINLRPLPPTAPPMRPRPRTASGQRGQGPASVRTGGPHMGFPFGAHLCASQLHPSSLQGASSPRNVCGVLKWIYMVVSCCAMLSGSEFDSASQAPGPADPALKGTLNEQPPLYFLRNLRRS